MTDRRSFDPFAPPPAHEPLFALTGVAQPPEPAEAPESNPDAATAAGLIPDDLDDITKPELIELAEMAGVATYGTKQDIADRIRAA